MYLSYLLDGSARPVYVPFGPRIFALLVLFLELKPTHPAKHSAKLPNLARPRPGPHWRTAGSSNLVLFKAHEGLTFGKSGMLHV